MDIGLPEILVVLVIVLIIFGPSRITDVMGALGKGIGEFRKGTQQPHNDEPKDPTTKPGA